MADKEKSKVAALIRSSTIGSIPWEKTIEPTTETMTLALIKIHLRHFGGANETRSLQELRQC